MLASNIAAQSDFTTTCKSDSSTWKGKSCSGKIVAAATGFYHTCFLERVGSLAKPFCAGAFDAFDVRLAYSDAILVRNDLFIGRNDFGQRCVI